LESFAASALSHNFTFRCHSPRWQNLVYPGLPISPPGRRNVSLPKCKWFMIWLVLGRDCHPIWHAGEGHGTEET
jgi:hypothetical protein